MSDVLSDTMNDTLASHYQFFQLDITGQVQGVGFRPYVYQLATEYKLTGVVYNHGQGVTAFIKATQDIIKNFIDELRTNLPPLASIDGVNTSIVNENKVKTFKVLPVSQAVAKQAPSKKAVSQKRQAITLEQLTGFTIAVSKQNAIDTQIASDAATCSACLAELLDSNSRRFRYPFINCTHCGPRYSIIEKLPYDRPFTTMKHFPMCSSCQCEYEAVSDRRFHAQPNACSACGPSLILFKATSQQTVNIVNSLAYSEEDLILKTIALIKQGLIIAIKGLGGYHLVCDANNDRAVKRLRDKKQRKTKPLSIMMATIKALNSVAEISEQAEKYLSSSSAPITLVKKKPNKQAEQLELLAPNMNSFGVMLPYTPLHHLLFQKQDDSGNYHTDESLCLVMTSANVRGAPLIYQEQELHQLASLSDYILSHNREIARRIDDSIVNCLNTADKDNTENDAIVIRRARGMAPKAINLNIDSTTSNKSTLAVGGFLKNSICLTKGNKAYLSQYIGDLSNPDNCRYLQQSVEQLMEMLQIKPAQVACDLHPDFYSSQFAQHFAQQHDIPLVKIQHHHAHCAAIACEHQLNEPYLGLSLDGVGLGNDGNAWGGECLFIEQGQAQRLAHFKNISLPGADIAAKQPWRIATAFLMKHNLAALAESKFSKHQAYDLVKQMFTKQINCPTTSSAGRLFDLAAALLGLCDVNSFEAEAAMLLESAAASGQVITSEKLFTIIHTDTQTHSENGKTDAMNQLDFTPLLLALPHMNTCDGAATFHEQLALGLSEWLVTITNNTEFDDCKKVVLSGGCFLNAHLTASVKKMLTGQGFIVFTAKQISPNDSSLALGQAWVAIEQLTKHEQNNVLTNQSSNNTNQEGDVVCA